VHPWFKDGEVGWVRVFEPCCRRCCRREEVPPQRRLLKIDETKPKPECGAK